MNIKWKSAVWLLAVGMVFSSLHGDEVQEVQEVQDKNISSQNDEKIRLKAEREQREREAYLEEKLEDDASNKSDVKSGIYGWNGSENYISTHSFAWHFCTYISATGNYVVLEDGSGWFVDAYDSYKTLDWYFNDVILVVPAPWFSFYDYMLINNRTGAHVLAIFKKKPRDVNEFTLFIREIDYTNHELVLSDDSTWTVLWLDLWTLNKWHLGQRVMLGVHQGWFKGALPNILINVETEEYIKARCLY